MLLRQFAGHIEIMRCLWLSQPGINAPGKERGNSLCPCNLTKCETWQVVVTMSKADAEMVRSRLAVSQGGTLYIKPGTHENICLTMQHYPLPGILPVALPSSGSAVRGGLLYLTEWEKCSVSDGADNARLLTLVLASIRSREVVSVLMNSLMSLQTISLFKRSVWGGLCSAELLQNFPTHFCQKALALGLAVLPGPAVTLTHSCLTTDNRVSKW